MIWRDADAGMTQFSVGSRNRGRILSKRYLNAPCKYGGAIGIATRAVAINPMLPNKPRGIRRVDDRRVLNGNRKDPICFSPYPYRARNLIERFFNKIKQCRRVATRYDKLAANYLAFIKLASICIWLRANESASQPGQSR